MGKNSLRSPGAGVEVAVLYPEKRVGSARCPVLSDPSITVADAVRVVESRGRVIR
jgi:hypothetical protein